MDKSILDTNVDRIEGMSFIFVDHTLLPDGKWLVGSNQLDTWRGGTGKTFAETFKRAEEDLGGGSAHLCHSVQIHVPAFGDAYWRSCLIWQLQEEEEAEREAKQAEAAS